MARSKEEGEDNFAGLLISSWSVTKKDRMPKKINMTKTTGLGKTKRERRKTIL